MISRANKHSTACTSIVSASEGLRLTAYQDGNGIWTIGYGHTAGVKQGQRCTYEQALIMLDNDLTIADTDIRTLVKAPLTQNQWDGLGSFVFNIGYERFKNSRVLFYLNDYDFLEAAAHFFDWEYVGGKISAGLVTRRKKEHDLFLKAA